MWPLRAIFAGYDVCDFVSLTLTGIAFALCFYAAMST
jgi:hypothetical protein